MIYCGNHTLGPRFKAKGQNRVKQSLCTMGMAKFSTGNMTNLMMFMTPKQLSSRWDLPEIPIFSSLFRTNRDVTRHLVRRGSAVNVSSVHLQGVGTRELELELGHDRDVQVMWKKRPPLLFFKFKGFELKFIQPLNH